jgi:hypothetical protein
MSAQRKFLFDGNAYSVIAARTRDENVLIMDTPDAHRPSDFGDADNRMLGLKLHSLHVRRAQ